MNDVICDHQYEVEGEILEIQFDENDMAEIVEKKCWMCYDCREVINNVTLENNDVKQVC